MRLFKKCERCGNYTRIDSRHTLCDDCAEAARTSGRNYAEQRRKSLILYTPHVAFILSTRPLRYVYLPHTWRLSRN